MSLSINLHKIHCKAESNEASHSDEPYVIVTSVQFGPVVDIRTFLFGPWEMDAGDDKVIVTEPPFWGLDAAPSDIVPVPIPIAPPPAPPPNPLPPPAVRARL